MAQIDLKMGDRVRLRRDVERYPHFIARAGMTGTVVIADHDTIAVRMDEHLDGCEEWDNEVIWSDDMDLLQDVDGDCEVLP